MVPVLRGLLLSLILHFLLSWGAQWIPIEASKKEVIEMNLIEAPSRQARQVVRDHEVPENQKTHLENEVPRFLSARTHSVKEQSKALNSGSTQNRSTEARKDPVKQNRLLKQKDKLKQALQSGLQTERAPTSEALFADKGFSTLGEDLPQEIKVGSFTALNTDRFLFYSFYARIENLIRFRWESMVTNTLERTNPLFFTSQSKSAWTTILEVWIKPSGELHSYNLLKSSGLNGFDQAAVQSFVQARMFPNPPADMRSKDGLIKVQYGFTVYPAPKNFVGN